MTDPDENVTNDWNDVHALTGAYAVDALDAEERDRFEEHLHRCSDCRAEVASLRETAATLAVDPADPPPSLRDRVLDGIETIRPLPPRISEPDAPPAPRDPFLRRLRRRMSGTPLLVAAVVILIAAVGGAMWLRPWADPAPGPTATERILAADDAVRVSQELPGGATATVVVARSEGRAVILTEAMPLAPDGKVYELWLQTPAGELRPAGLMPDQRDATVLLEGDASRATGVGITVEPDGGSPEPTTDPIAFFDIET